MVNIMEVMGSKVLLIRSRKLCIFWVAMLMIPNCLLADVKVIPSVAASIGYTDNVALSNDANAVSSNIIELTPGVSFLANSRNLDAALQYQFQNLYFTDVAASGEDNYQNYHKLNGNLAAEVYKNLLYFDGALSVYQISETGQGLQTLDNLSLSAQRGTVKQATLSPYLSTRIGEYANTEIRYQYTSLNGDETVVNESYVSEITLSLDSGEKFNRIIWGLDAVNRDIVYEQQDNLHFKSIQFGADYELRSGVDFLMQVGHEKNEYLTLGNVSTEDNYWSVGVRLQPTGRTNVLLRAGHRFFGNTGMVDVNHRAKNSSWNISYIEDITTRSAVDIESQIVPTSSGFEILSTPTLSTEAILRKRTSAGVQLNYRKISGYLNASQTRHDYQLSGDKEKINAGEVGVSWEYSAKAEVTATNYMLRNNSITSPSWEKIKQWIFAMNYRASEKSTFKMEYRNSDRETDTGTGEYKQNIYSLGLNVKI